MSAEDNRRSMERAFEAFNRRDFDEVRATAADDYVDHEAPAELGSGFEATERNLGRMIEAFPDVHWEVLQIVADERGGAARARMTGTHKGSFMGIDATGRRIAIEIVDFLRFADDGKVTAHWGYIDRMDLLGQLGAIEAVAAR